MTTTQQANENMDKGLIYNGYPYVDPGTNLFMPITLRSGTIVVPVVVTETQDIYSVNNKSYWYSKFIDGSEGVYIDDNTKCILSEFLEKYPQAKKVNQFLWVDESVGHAIQLGDEVFLTLNEALLHAKPSKRKHLKRKLKAYRNSVHRFIASTWESNGDKHPGFPKMPDKKVYVRKK